MVTFLGYISDNDNTVPAGTARMLFGMDSAADTSSLPTVSGYVFPDGTSTQPPAAWSIAIYPGGRKVMTSGKIWTDL